ncbi:MAG: hypothetical protein MUC43_05090, partial [Pirellula sp.]|nr:hypothetical protein [Pirellula sp.]
SHSPLSNSIATITRQSKNQANGLQKESSAVIAVRLDCQEIVMNRPEWSQIATSWQFELDRGRSLRDWLRR